MRKIRDHLSAAVLCILLVAGMCSFAGCSRQSEQEVASDGNFLLDVAAVSVIDDTLRISFSITDVTDEAVDSILSRRPFPGKILINGKNAFYNYDSEYDYNNDMLYFSAWMSPHELMFGEQTEISISGLFQTVDTEDCVVDFDVYGQLQLQGESSGLPGPAEGERREWNWNPVEMENIDEFHAWRELLGQDPGPEMNYWDIPDGGLNYTVLEEPWLVIDRIDYFPFFFYAKLRYDPVTHVNFRELTLLDTAGQPLKRPIFTRYGYDNEKLESEGVTELLIPVENMEALEGTSIIFAASYRDYVLEDTLTAVYVFDEPEEKRTEGAFELKDGGVVEEVVVTPLAVVVKGSNLWEPGPVRDLTIYLEMKGDTAYHSFSRNNSSTEVLEEGGYFNRFETWAQTPVDLSQVVAVLINDTRIPLD